MGLSARNGKTVDRRNEGGSEKNEIGVRNGKRKLTISVDWIGAWIVSGSEWIGAIFVECVELGSWADRSGSELGCVELGSWCVGVGGSLWLGVWVGAVKAWQRQCVCERLVRVREGRKRFEVKITTEINFSRFWLIFRSNWKHFQFDRILQNNQMPYFPEIDFRKSISVKTNGA